jgi:hypothetical protein
VNDRDVRVSAIFSPDAPLIGPDERLRAHVVRDTLDHDLLVVRAPLLTQAEVHLTLHVHEHQAAREPDGHHDQLGPEGPLQRARGQFLRGAVDQHVQRPDHARDGDHVERHGARDLTPLSLTHVQTFPLKHGVKGYVNYND